MKSWIKIAIYVLTAATIAVLIVIATMQKRHLNSLEKQVEEQSIVIDSLLKRRMSVLDVKLNVTDKSRNIIYGRYNKGYIYQPQERVYRLEMDSSCYQLKIEN